MIQSTGFAAHHFRKVLKPFHFTRKDPGVHEVQIDVLYCGVCHSDLHQVKNDWKNTIYPCVPGHEIVGRAAKVGAKVTKFKVGDLVGVGCMINSCGQCKHCKEGLEQYCAKGFMATYNGPMMPDGKGTNTFGGYSNNLVVNEDFVLNIPENLELSAIPPILCAGVTTYSPLKHWKVKKGDHIAVAGLGGLGHMAVKLAVAMGAKVTVISTSPEKKKDAKRLGATSFLLSTDKKAMKAHENKFSFILSTIPDKHDIDPYVATLDLNGTLCMVGVLVPEPGHDQMKVAQARRSIGGSLIGGIAETQEVLDFCGKHNITADVELIDLHEINDAFTKMDKGEVRFRYVIDMASINEEVSENETHPSNKKPKSVTKKPH